MTNALAQAKKIIFRSLGEFFANPDIAALCEIHPVTAGIAQYLGGNYAQEQFETLTDFVHLLHARLQTAENKKIDKGFLETKEGKRMIGKAFRAVVRDNRKEKLEAMANLIVNLQYNSRLSVDEKELYIDILDTLNSLQLSILGKAVNDMRTRTDSHPHRGLGWELLYKQFQQLKISKALFLQSIRTLESNGLINQNNTTLQETDRTHFITDFGEQFYDFISTVLKENSSYLE